MSFIKDALFGQPGEAATVQDVRSDADRALRTQSGNVLGGFLANPTSIPTYTGPFAAGLQPMESHFLNLLADYTGGAGANTVGTGQQTVRNVAGGAGAFNPLLNPELTSSTQGLMQRILSGQTMDPNQDAMLRSAIQTAQQPLIERFGDDMGSAVGAFTRAGQFVQPGASSPFELAKARLQTGLANAMGDVATNISFGNMMSERQRQSDVMDRVSNMGESGLGRQLTAASSTPAFTSGVLDSIMKGLNANALPRMIEQAGIEGGVDQFNQQRNAFLQMLQTAFGGTAPRPVGLPGSEGSGGLFGALAPAIGTAIGGPVGGAIGGKVAGWIGG